jgi:hypothetical protein
MTSGKLPEFAWKSGRFSFSFRLTEGFERAGRKGFGAKARDRFAGLTTRTRSAVPPEKP